MASRITLRRLLIFFGGVLVLLTVAYAAARPLLLAEVEDRFNHTLRPGPIEVSAAAQRLHDGAQVVDLHADSLLWSRDLLQSSTHGQVDLPRLRRGGVALQVFGLVTQSPEGMNFQKNSADTDRIRLMVMATGWPPRTWDSFHERALHQLRRLKEMAADSDGALRVIGTQRDLAELIEARRSGNDVIGTFGGLEGAHAATDIDELRRLRAAGLRMIGLAHFIDNPVAGSAHGMEKYGLTDLGRDLVREAERLGIAVDLAHASPRTISDVLAIATKPVVVSHGGVAGTCPGPRTLTDAQLRGVAATGGLVGIGYFHGAICGDDAQSIAKAIVYAVRVAGADHVGLGSDFDGSVTTPFDASGLPALTQALLDQGLPPTTIEKVLGGNAIRVLSQTLPDA